MNDVLDNTALIYCEEQFGLDDGKTATGLIRHSEFYNVVGVIDSTLANKDSGEELGLKRNNIPIFKDLSDAIGSLSYIPKYYIYGKAPVNTHIESGERDLILQAMEQGMSIVNGLHQIFSDDEEFAQKAIKKNIEILDIRKPPRLEDLHPFVNKLSKVDVPIVAVLGTDCACGKMTTARALNEELNAIGIKSVLIATGQTALMQGAKYGICIDAIPSQFVIGEIEHSVIEAYKNEQPNIILVEGQSSLGHEAFMSSTAILKGCKPDGIILQHPPGRKYRVDFPSLEMPKIENELFLIEAVAETDLLAITINPEGLQESEICEIIGNYEEQFQVPTVDILKNGCQKIIEFLMDQYPEIKTVI